MFKRRHTRSSYPDLKTSEIKKFSFLIPRENLPSVESPNHYLRSNCPGRYF